jgi:ABC-type glycerol-3-phosphate transport system substrate-binding protein
MKCQMTNFRCLGAAGFSLLLATSLPAKPLDIWISSYQDKVYYEDMVRIYQEKVDKNFQANVVAYGFREMPDKLAVAIKTGANPPDIVQLDEILFGTYLGGEVPFVDLTERVKKAKLDQDIVPQRMALFAKGKTIYGLPQSLSAMLLYYRTDLFEKFNLTPDDLSTWDDFVREGARLAEKGQAMIGLDPSYFEILLRQRGSDWFGKDGKAFPNYSLAVDTLKWIRHLSEKGIGLQPERGTIFDPVFFSTTVSSDAILCVIGADWYGLDMLQQFTPQLKGKWGLMPLPAWRKADGTLGPRTSSYAGQGLLIFKDSKEVEAAWKFIHFVMTDKEANVQRYLKGNSFTAYKPAWKDPRMTKDIEFFHDQPMGKILIGLAPQLPTVVMNPKRPQAVFMFQENFFSSFMYGQMTAEETIDKMKAILDKP